MSADGVTPPWLVYEWFVVEAFVRAQGELKEAIGIPGIQKVQRALRNQRPVSASAYLKTPTVFGFSGVFRRLARRIGILAEDGRLDDGGYELVTAWAKDQGLGGILDSSTGPGHDFREKLRRAVAQGMEKGHTTHQPGDFWREVARRLDPSRPGARESKVLHHRLRDRSGPPDMVRHLIDALVRRRAVVEPDEEAAFLRSITGRAPIEMREILSAIDAYEGFCRVLTDVFDELRYLSSSARGALIGADELARWAKSVSALEALRSSLDRVRTHGHLLEWEQGLEGALARFESVATESALFGAILEHHEQVQRDKPPEGKRPWFERGREAKVLVRPGFLVEEAPAAHGGYVHEYRVPTFSRFLADLGAYA
jgi:hypothetical protein